MGPKAGGVAVAGLLAVVFGLAGCNGDSSDPADVAAGAPTAADTQKVSGEFSIYPNGWFKTVPGTDWNRCEGEPECDGLECYGIGQADGLAFATGVLVTNGTDDRIALGQVDKTWGWQKGATRGACVLYWSVEIPAAESGVLTATFAGNPDWAENFTLAKLKKAPHALDLVGIGDLDS